MSRSSIERRLRDNSERLRRARQELAVIDEQLEALRDSADDARIRSLVSETPGAQHEYAEAQRHVDAMSRSRRLVADSIANLVATQDELLDRLALGS